MAIYLDHAATTPLRSEARQAWLAAQERLGNAAATHSAGQRVRRLLEESRERVAAVLGCDPVEVVFTSGGTEAISTAVQGMWRRRAAPSVDIVLPDAEHPATIATVAALAAEGAGVRRVPVCERGRIDAKAFAGALPGAAVATALVANNEVGTLNDARGLATAAAAAAVPLHLDAVAALGQVPLDFRTLRGDAPAGAGLVALSISGHKVGAPVGVGALVVARSARIAPLLHGSASQRGLRAGTADVAGAAALAVALELAEAEREHESRRLRALRERLVAGVLREAPAELLGDPVTRLPGNAHLLFPGAVGESLLFLLDTAGIAASSGSACQAGVAEPSHVVLAMGRTAREARSVVRFSLGRTSSAADVDALVAVIGDAVARASRAG